MQNNTITKILISQEFFDYLFVNGFDGSWSKDGHTWTAIHNDKLIHIKFDRISFSTFCEGDEQTYPDFSEYGSVDGVSQLDLFKFQLILHAFDIVPLQQFIKRVRHTEPDLFNDLSNLVRPMQMAGIY